MTVDQSRFGGDLETPPEVDEMMANITDLTGCAIILLPKELTEKFRETCEQNGVNPAEVVSHSGRGDFNGDRTKCPVRSNTHSLLFRLSTDDGPAH